MANLSETNGRGIAKLGAEAGSPAETPGAGEETPSSSSSFSSSTPLPPGAKKKRPHVDAATDQNAEDLIGPLDYDDTRYWAASVHTL